MKNEASRTARIWQDVAICFNINAQMGLPLIWHGIWGTITYVELNPRLLRYIEKVLSRFNFRFPHWTDGSSGTDCHMDMETEYSENLLCSDKSQCDNMGEPGQCRRLHKKLYVLTICLKWDVWKPRKTSKIILLRKNGNKEEWRGSENEENNNGT